MDYRGPKAKVVVINLSDIPKPPTIPRYVRDINHLNGNVEKTFEPHSSCGHSNIRK